MTSFSGFFIVLFASIFFASISRRVHFPWVIALILSGVVIGPHGLNVFEVDSTFKFISDTGLVLLMFMAGLEMRLSSFKKFQSKMLLLAFVNGFVPFIVGLLLGNLILGYSLVTSALIGIIFVSSSVAVVIPALESTKLLKTNLGSSVLATSILQDVASLVLLSFFLQTEQPLANLPLVMFYPIVAIVLIVIKLGLPSFQQFIMKETTESDDIFHRDVRVVLLVIFGTVIILELLGLHPIIAGFFAGFVLSESIDSEILRGKIRAISYGVFIPTFFVVVGTQTDLGLFLQAGNTLYVTIIIVCGSMLSKFLSGTIGARAVGFNRSQSMFFGVTSIPQLSTTLAATFAAMEFNILTPELVTAMVALSIVTTTVSPLLISIFQEHLLSKSDIKRKNV